MGRALAFYRTEKGRCPVNEFLDSLPGKVAQKVAWVLKLVQELDLVPTQYLKKLTASDEIWECRVVHGRNTYRILGKVWEPSLSSVFFHGRSRMVLTHGFTKKTHKTPPHEIAEAQRLKADHIRRYGNA